MNKPRMFHERGWWVCRQVLTEPTLKGVICIGRGRTTETAWKDFSRKHNWYRKGCPGMPFRKWKVENSK